MSNKELITKYKVLFNSLKFQKSLEFRITLLRTIENQSLVLKQGEYPEHYNKDFKEYSCELLLKLYKQLGWDKNNPLTSIQSMKS